MTDVEKQVLREVERLLAEGRSLVITTVDEPGSVDLSGLGDNIIAGVGFAVDDTQTRARRCVQRVTLPDGTVICIRYEE